MSFEARQWREWFLFLVVLPVRQGGAQTEQIFDPRPGFQPNSLATTTVLGPQTRIIGGTDSLRGRYPYFVSLIDVNGRHTCGGSLVAPDVVLTAAHCQGVPSRAHVGRWNRSDANDDYDDFPITIPEFPHPNYVESSFEYDFLLLKLEGSSSRPFIQLNANPNIPQSDVTDEVTVIGFGNTISGVQSLAEILQEVSLSYIPNSVCELSKDSSLDLSYQNKIIDAMLCAGDSGQDSCQGDSGGPLVLSGGSADQDVQVGVISWGFGCALPAFPGVYARVSAEMEWLRSMICEVSSNPPEYLSCSTNATLPPLSVPVTVAIQLDDFPEETSWSITDKVDGTKFAEVPFGSYSIAESRVRETVFLPAGRSMVFQIDDSFGDGLCCNTPGNYIISLGSRPFGQVLVSGGGAFDGAQYHEFDVPSEFKETIDENDALSIGPGQIPLTLFLQLDQNPQDIGWKVEQLGIELETVIDIPAGVYKVPGATIVRTVILDKNELYYFRVYDVTSNGMDGGLVKLFLGTTNVDDDSMKIYEADGEFKGGVDFSFLATTDPQPTSAPVVDTGAHLTLQLYLDMYPGEIGVQLRAKNIDMSMEGPSTRDNTVVFFRPPRYYIDFVNERVTEKIPIPLPPAGGSREFVLIVTDSFSDGLCCNWNRTAQTGYTLYNGDLSSGEILAESRFIGVAREVTTFTIDSQVDDTTNDGTGPSSPSDEQDLIQIKVTITLDSFPDETGFYIENDAGFRVADFPSGTYKGLEELVEEFFNITAGVYTFTLLDAYGDGINRDDSYYRIDIVSGEGARLPVLAGDGLFVTQKSTVFALEGNSADYPMTIKFTTDDKPEEFSFVVKRLDLLDSDAIVASAPKGTYNAKSTTVTEKIMVRERSLYRITFEDAGKDGMGGAIEIVMGSDNSNDFNAKSYEVDGRFLSADQIKIYAGRPPVPVPDGISLELRITFDQYPHEVEWVLVDGADPFSVDKSSAISWEVVAYGPIEPYNETLAGTEHVETIAIPDHKGEKIFSMIVTDAAGDGVCCLFGSGGPVELYQNSINKEVPFFSEPFAGVDRVVESFVIMGSGGSSASTSGFSPLLLISLLGAASLLQ